MTETPSERHLRKLKEAGNYVEQPYIVGCINGNALKTVPKEYWLYFEESQKILLEEAKKVFERSRQMGFTKIISTQKNPVKIVTKENISERSDS